MSGDDKELSPLEKDRLKLFAQMQKLKIIDVNKNPYRQIETTIGVYKKEDVKKYLKSPESEASQKQLRKVSKYLYNSSQQYKKAVDYYGTMLKLDYYIEPYDLDVSKIDKVKFEKEYNKVVSVVENMHVKHEYGKAIHQSYRDGVYYGYRHIGEDSFFIQPLDPDFCKVTGIDDGCYQISFNLAYFFTYPEQIEVFPAEFKRKYNEISAPDNKKNRSATYWVDLDINKTVCLISGINWFPIPPIIQLFDSILDILDYKEIEKINKRIDIYKLIHQKIPFGKDIDDFLLNADKAKFYNDLLAEILPDDIGQITSPMDISEVSFQKDTVDKNKVSEATRQLWDDAGISHLLFSGDNTSVGLNEGIRADESPVFNILRQVERDINRYIKVNIKTKSKFRVKMLDTTRYNFKEVQKSFLESAQYGINKSQYFASLGMEPSSASNMAFLENEILKLSTALVPMTSPHTSSSDGRPPKDTVGDSGTKQRDNLANEN